jgi:hypothetical protein
MTQRSRFLSACIGVALLFGLFVQLPHIWQMSDPNYQGVHMMGTDAEAHYAARVSEAWDGHTTVANVFYSQPKDVPYLQPPYPELTIAIIAHVFNIQPVTAFVWSKGVFAFILALVFIGCFVSISGRKWEALLAVTALLFAGSFFGAPWDLLKVLTGEGGGEFLRFGRPINPLWTASWFFGALWLLSVWLRTRKIVPVIGAALCTVVALYSYVYAWSYNGIILSVVFIHALCIRDWKKVLHLLLFAGIFFLLGTPYFVHLFGSLRHPLYEAASPRMGVAELYTPVLGIWTPFFLIVVLLSRRFWKEQWWLLMGCAIGAVIVLNQQVVTGMYLVPHHYHWYFIHPLAVIITLILVFSFSKRLRVPAAVQTGGYCIAVILSVVYGLLFQMQSYASAQQIWGDQQQFGLLMTQMRETLPAESVVYARDRRLLDLIPIYTSLNVYTATSAHLYLVEPAQIRDALYFSLWLDGLDPVDAPAAFKGELRTLVSERIYAIYYREKLGSYDAIPDDVLDVHAREYAEYIRRTTAQKLCMYPLNFIVFEKDDPETAAWNMLREQSDVMFSTGAFEVRHIRDSVCGS